MQPQRTRARRSAAATCFEMEWVRRDGRLYVVDLGLVEEIPVPDIVGTRLVCREARRGLAARLRGWPQVLRLKYLLRRGADTPLPRLYRIAQSYYIDSGHAVVAAAKALGRRRIRAHVVAYESPASNMEGLVSRERAEFEQRTGLRSVRLALPGRYPQLLGYIEQHHKYLEGTRAQLFRFDEAVADWWQNIYAPVLEGMARGGVTACIKELGPGECFCLLAEYLDRQATGPEMPLSQAFLELIGSDLDWREKAATFVPPCLLGPRCPYG